MAVNESRFQGKSTVFYLTGWGHSGDHWLSKALNAHPEIFVINCYEPTRLKYFNDGKDRGYRPDILTMTAFLEDIGTDYQAIGECHAYRSSQLPPLREKYGSTIPDANILRHPYTWLDFYIRHRVNNCRMPGEWSGSLEHEWQHANHGLFRRLGLPAYEKKQVDIWSAYQGMWLLHNILVDLKFGSKMARIEDLTTKPEALNDLVSHITHEKCQFSPALIDTVFEFAKLDYRGEETYVDPEAAWETWPTWKREAFSVLVPEQIQDAYASVGYNLNVERKTLFATLDELSVKNAEERPIVFTSMMKSGTWLMREIIKQMTGLSPLDPKPATTAADYANPEMIDIQPGTFLSSHLEASPAVRDKLRSSHAKVIFLYRNVGDVLLSLYHHFLNDVDKCIGSPTGNDTFLSSLSEDDAISLMITGFSIHPYHWDGAQTFFRQMNSWLEFSKEWPVHFVSYENLMYNKEIELKRLREFLGDDAKALDNNTIMQATEFTVMKDKASLDGRDGHYRRGKAGEHLNRFTEHHFHLLETVMCQFDPNFEGNFCETPHRDFCFQRKMINEYRLLMNRLEELCAQKGVTELRVAICGTWLLTKKLALTVKPWFVPVAITLLNNYRPHPSIPGVTLDHLHETAADCVVIFDCDETALQAAEQAAYTMGATIVRLKDSKTETSWIVKGN